MTTPTVTTPAVQGRLHRDAARGQQEQSGRAEHQVAAWGCGQVMEKYPGGDAHVASRGFTVRAAPDFGRRYAGPHARP